MDEPEERSFNGESLQRITTSTAITGTLLTWTVEHECFWLLDVYASHLCAIDPKREWFTCLEISVMHSAARIVIHDGNHNKLAAQRVDYTDFALPYAKLYAVWQQPYWVIMLPEDY
jgi:hypothetical protein